MAAIEGRWNDEMAGSEVLFAWPDVANPRNLFAITLPPPLGSLIDGRPRLHHAGEITAGGARQRRLLHCPGDILDVAWIDRGRHGPHQRRRLADGRSRYLRHLKNRGIAEGLEPNCALDLFLSDLASAA